MFGLVGLVLEADLRHTHLSMASPPLARRGGGGEGGQRPLGNGWCGGHLGLRYQTWAVGGSYERRHWPMGCDWGGARRWYAALMSPCSVLAPGDLPALVGGLVGGRGP